MKMSELREEALRIAFELKACRESKMPVYGNVKNKIQETRALKKEAPTTALHNFYKGFIAGMEEALQMVEEKNRLAEAKNGL